METRKHAVGMTAARWMLGQFRRRKSESHSSGPEADQMARTQAMELAAHS